MQVNFTTRVSPPVAGVRPASPLRSGAQGADRAEFAQTDALQRALEQTPDIRPEAVWRARDLFQQVPYPPVEIIQGISRLLANEWTGIEA